MFLAEIDTEFLVKLGAGLVTTGTAAGMVVFGAKAVKAVKNVFATRKGFADTAAGLWEAGKSLLEEGTELARQIQVLSKAAADSDKAVDRVKQSDKLRRGIVELANQEGLTDEEREALAQLMTPISAGIRHYGGLETDKLAKLKDAMEKDLSAQETNNAIMENTGKMARVLAKAALTIGPKVLSGGTINLDGLLQSADKDK